MAAGEKELTPGFRYQQLALELEEKIRGGQYRVGERLPSLRELHNRTALSITTIAHAYMELEARGMVESRERSGYYVRPLIRNLLPLPLTELQPVARPRKVPINPLAESILSAIRDRDVLPFGEALPANTLLPSRQLARSARAVTATYFEGGGLHYDPANGVAALKRQIAARSIGFCRGIDAEEIIVTNGCMDAIRLCLRAVAQPGDIVIIESPTFSCYLQLIGKMGLLALEIPTSPRTGIDLGLLEEALFNGVWRRNRVAACLLNPSFHNPLGFHMADESKRELVEMLAVHGVPLIEDDSCGELSIGDSRPAPLKSFDTRGLVLYCSSFSKTVAPDFRVGWVVPGRFREEILRLKFNSSIAQAKLPQLILADFFENRQYERHLRRLRVAIKGQLGSTSHAIARYFPEGTKMTAPEGGYMIWLELAADVDGVKLFHLAREEGIFIVPGVVFSSTGRFNNCIRISCGTPWSERMEKGMERLGVLVDRLQSA
ncbi:aminotransferase-like domain-containing protein [Desulfogranum mediterraneum]|uniref:aminotransferase-like domain-containing protein n=1 Tax=Desulfogranum mediterraneum TaxID=160661 RepID=UPI0003F9DE7B|nr:PLP-dependent aminotransferase family protein [Desulfogranum mediterraneum]